MSIMAGQAVSFTIGDGQVFVIGRVESHDEKTAKVKEAHAFSVWGGSNGGRGEIHEVSIKDLVPARPRHKRIVDSALPR